MNTYTHIKATFYFLFLIFFSIQPVCAQTTETDTLRAQMDEIKVEATYSNITVDEAPFAITQFTRTPFQQNTTPGLTLSEITDRVPGIWVNQRENFAVGERITIRGMGWRASFGVRGIQVVLDGIPITVADGQSMLDVVDPAMIQSLEVLRGPSSTLWGNSSGGVLYIKTVQPDNDRINIRTQGGSYGLTKNEFQISRSMGDHFISGYTTIHAENGFRDHSAVTLSRSALNARFLLADQTILSVNSALSVMPRAKSPSSLTKSQLMEDPVQARGIFEASDAGKQVTQGQLGLKLQHQLNNNWMFESSAYGILRDLRNPLPFAFIDLNRKAAGLRNVVHTKKGNFTIAGGAEMKMQFDERANFNTVDGARGDEISLQQDERVLNEAVFAKLGFRAGSLNISGGIRLDALQFNTNDRLLTNEDQSGSESFTSISPSFGVNYQFNRQTFFTNFSTAFEAPTTTELVNRPDGLGGFNSQLQPEQTRSIETGLRGRISSLRTSYDAALYAMWVDDLLLPFQIEGTDRTFFRNEGKSRHSGAELVVETKLLQRLNILVNYNWTFAQFRAGNLDELTLKGNRIPGVTPHRLFSELQYQAKHFELSGGVRYVDSFYPDSENSITVDSYALIHAKAGFNQLAISESIFASPFIALNNLTDKTYSSSVSVNAFGGRFFEPGADLNFELGLSLTFK